MNFKETGVKGALLVEPAAFEDDRGYFMRAFCRNELKEAGVDFEVAQANMAGSTSRATLRGMHYQISPYEEGKLIRCTRGSVFDVVLDIRPGSESYGSWFGTELTPGNRNMLYVPPGCAHGYLTLEEHTEVYYLVSEFYSPGSERGIRWNDPQFTIDWPIRENLVMSDKDVAWPDFNVSEDDI